MLAATPAEALLLFAKALVRQLAFTSGELPCRWLAQVFLHNINSNAYTFLMHCDDALFQHRVIPMSSTASQRFFTESPHACLWWYTEGLLQVEAPMLHTSDDIGQHI